MEARRRVAWLVSAGLLLCAGLAAGWATYLSWLPCRGSMLVATPLGPADADVPNACYERMDQGLPLDVGAVGAASLVNELIGLTLLAAALAWLVLVITSRWRRWERWCLLSLAVALGLASVAVWLGARAGDALFAVLVLITLTALVVALVLLARMADGDSDVRRMWVPLLAVGSLGLFGRVGEYLVMTMWSELNWDTPPGTGYLGAGLLVVASIAMLPLAPRRLPVSGDAARERRQRRSPEIGSLPA